MSDRPEEDRSWTDGSDPDRAVEDLRAGINRLKGQVADFRQHMTDGAVAEDDDATA